MVYITLGITGFLDLVCPSLFKGMQHFWKLDLFLCSSEERVRPTLLVQLDRANISLRLALSNGPNSVGVHQPPSPEGGNSFNFQNSVFFGVIYTLPW
jgi:hypothetical protein